MAFRGLGSYAYRKQDRTSRLKNGGRQATKSGWPLLQRENKEINKVRLPLYRDSAGGPILIDRLVEEVIGWLVFRRAEVWGRGSSRYRVSR